MQGIACPKRGNTLLTHRIASHLGIKSSFVKDSILFGHWMEGRLRSGDRAILVDDVASDGELLLEAIDDLRRAGIYVREVNVLVDRAEGDVAAVLPASGVPYSYFCRLSDADLERV